MLKGIVPVYKEKGFTSFDVVAKLRGILKNKKIGHTGTLDPDAEGVLPVCVGPATRLVEMLTDSSKEYEARMLFGIKTDTQDISGRILDRSVLKSSEDDIINVIHSFKGEYDQIPPMYSALKVNGKKLYELAREGKTVERKPRRVHIYDIEILRSDISCEPPFADIRVSCSKGTYIRTLINDIGEKLGCGACMEKLLRTQSAGFGLADCFKLSEIEARVKTCGAESVLIPVEYFFKEYPCVNVVPECDNMLKNGNRLGEDCFNGKIPDSELIRVCDSQGSFQAVYKKNDGVYKVKYML